MAHPDVRYRRVAAGEAVPPAVYYEAQPDYYGAAPRDGWSVRLRRTVCETCAGTWGPWSGMWHTIASGLTEDAARARAAEVEALSREEQRALWIRHAPATSWSPATQIPYPEPG